MVEGSSPGSWGPKGVQLGWDLDRQTGRWGEEGCGSRRSLTALQLIYTKIY